MATVSKDVKFFVLVLFNVSCVILCGWYGIQNILKSRSEAGTLLDRNDDASKLKRVR
jgi:hypothetical protein